MEKLRRKIGVGILTYNRPEYYQQVLESIPKDRIDCLVIVNDGAFSYVKDQDGDCVVKNNKQLGVSVSKNIILKKIVEEYDCEHVFLIEDDIIIKDPNVFDEYIKAANTTGIHHLCFAKIQKNEETLKYVLKHSNGIDIGFYHNPKGAFMYINATLVKKLGFFDENYINAYEHIDFTYTLTRNNVAPPFWYFPDILNSDKYLDIVEGSVDNSTISNRENYVKNANLSSDYWIKKWGSFTINIEEDDLRTLNQKLAILQSRYSRKKLVNKGKKLSIIIPYRNRREALDKIIPSLTEYVSKQVEDFEILVVEQSNNNPFNKGLLNNIGFCNSSKNSDYFCFHDVDLIPEFSDYSFPVMPTHMSTHCSQFNYINIPDKIMGGVILFNKEHLLTVNGYSNEFVGWGKEDDDLYKRCEIENLTPYKSQLGAFYSVPHIHRLSDPVENQLHEKNGLRFKKFSEGLLEKDYHKSDGISNCLSFVKTIDIKIIENKYKHILVDF
jgi:hypothetical protein